MKISALKLITPFIVIALLFTNSVLADSANVLNTTITVKNMTDQSLVIQSGASSSFISPFIQINGLSQQTPTETIPAESSEKFIISDNGLNGVITGHIILEVEYDTDACGTFPLWAGGNGVDHTVWINAPLTTTSNSQYIVGAYEIDETHAVMDVYPAVLRKSRLMFDKNK